MLNHVFVCIKVKMWQEQKCGMQDASVSLIFLSHFYIFCDLILNRLTVTWNLFVLYDEKKIIICDVVCASLDQSQEAIKMRVLLIKIHENT